MTRLLCCGDTHIGQGVNLYPERLGEQEEVWRFILQHARSENADAVLHAGDMWERRKPSPQELLAAERPLVDHRAAGGCPVIVCAGNHDIAGTDDTLALQVLAEAGLIVLSTRPETIPVGGLHVATLPWTPVSRLVASHGGGDRDRTHTDAGRMLVDAARRLRASTPGPCVLLAHWSVTGMSLPNGLPTDTIRDTVLDLDELLAIGFDEIVLGHIHRAQRNGAAFYVGSPMPLNHGEGGFDHGVTMVDVSDDVTSVYVPVPSTPFVTLRLDDSLDEARGAVVRFKDIVSDRWDDRAAFASNAYDAGARHVSFDLTVQRPTRARVQIDDTATVADAFAAWIDANHIDGDQAPVLTALHRHYEEATA